MASWQPQTRVVSSPLGRKKERSGTKASRRANECKCFVVPIVSAASWCGPRCAVLALLLSGSSGGCGCGRAITSRAARVLGSAVSIMETTTRIDRFSAPQGRVASTTGTQARGGGLVVVVSRVWLACPALGRPLLTKGTCVRGAISFCVSLKIRLRSSRGPLDWMYSYSYTRRATSNDWSLAQPAAERR